MLVSIANIPCLMQKTSICILLYSFKAAELDYQKLVLFNVQISDVQNLF